MYLCTKIVRFPAHLVRRGLILAGGAAGIAAAFNAPIAGIVFAFEEVGRSFEKDNAGTIIGGLFAQAVASVTPRISALSRQRPYVVAGSLGLALGVLGLISGGLTYGSGFVEAQRILIEGDAYPISYPFLKALASFVTLISGIPGGLFDPKPLGGCRTRATDSSGLSRHQPAGGDSPHHGGVFLRSGAKPAHLGRDFVRDDCLAPHGPAAPRHLDPGL